MITKQQYIEYLISTIATYTGSHLAEHLDDVSHDVITDYLGTEHLTARAALKTYQARPCTPRRSTCVTNSASSLLQHQWQVDQRLPRAVEGVRGRTAWRVVIDGQSGCA